MSRTGYGSAPSRKGPDGAGGRAVSACAAALGAGRARGDERRDGLVIAGDVAVHLAGLICVGRVDAALGADAAEMVVELVAQLVKAAVGAIVRIVGSAGPPQAASSARAWRECRRS